MGAGVQGLFQLRYLALLRTVKQVTVYDTSAAQARRYAERMTAELGLPVTPCETLAAAVGEADIILTATWANRPILFADQVRDGCHITTLGADQPGEAEIDAGLIRRARFICDDRELALAQGAIGGVGLGADAIAAELGEVINGTRPGRTDPDQITIYGAVGLAFQDLVTAWQVFCHARSRPLPQTIDFLA